MVAVQAPSEKQILMVDKAAIEAIVIEILSRQESKQESMKEIERDIPLRVIALEVEMQDKKRETEEVDEAFETNINNDMRVLIANTMSAFRNI